VKHGVMAGSYQSRVTESHGTRRLEKWWEAASKRPSVVATIVCKERLIAGYTQYAKNEATSDFAKNFRK
jgi:hypothetical protein